ALAASGPLAARAALAAALAALGCAAAARGQEGPAGAAPGPASCPLSVSALTTPDVDPGAVPEPAWDLRCIELLPTGVAVGARGVVTLARPPSPFAVTVTVEGRHVYALSARVEGLPRPETLGPYAAYVAWATPLTFDPVIRLGALGGGTADLGRVDFSAFLILVTAEASADVTERRGPIVLRGRSPSTRLAAHDLLATAPAAETGGARANGEDHRHGDADAGDADAGDAWPLPPMYAGVPMLPGIMALRPGVRPLKLAPGRPAGVAESVATGVLPDAEPRRLVRLPDGGTLDLTAGLVRRAIAGRTMAMLAFNRQHPGPLIEVDANTTIFVNFTNASPLPTAVHWHGVRLDNRFDGVPGVTQDPVPPGGTFRYTVRFPDAGIYWYHPHHREDVQQELGLAGNLLVRPPDPAAYGPVHREAVLMLDDLLADDAGPVPFGREAATHALMGRFGNLPLVNGEPEYTLEVDRGEVVRFYLTNASNTRTWNLSVSPAAGRGGSGAAPSDGHLPIKVVATDVGRFEREELVESVVIAPAERYVVDVRFPAAGRFQLTNRVLGINHRQGVFLAEEMPLGTITVADRDVQGDLGEAFETLREHADVVAEIDRYRDRFDDPIDREIVLALEADSLPDLIVQSMRYDWVYFHPVEWTGTMPVMNWATTADRVRWTIREPSTGNADMDIDWRFRAGDVVKIRVHNDRTSFHAMQHPLHIHGQRFLVLAQDGVPVANRAWKDTVLLPAGSVTDILLELSNPGRWMVHCHIAEHLESGMKFVFEVEEAGS
ncbi:MAG TPA: multicopper oxidase family protein, partial [Longimicrobiales bacterium]|nr:multicopper oxidase family protein [Longimicrobiales bacterium]